MSGWSKEERDAAKAAWDARSPEDQRREIDAFRAGAEWGKSSKEPTPTSEIHARIFCIIFAIMILLPLGYWIVSALHETPMGTGVGPVYDPDAVDR